MLIGDFNEILLPSEVRGGNFYINRAQKFGDMMDSCNLLDLGFKGPTHTSHRCVNGLKKISKRLDRVLVDYDWRTQFPEASCIHLHRQYSDHNPLHVKLHIVSQFRGSHPFRFEAAWASHPQFLDIVKKAWLNADGSVVNCLSAVKEAAILFNHEIFGNIFQGKKAHI